MQLNTSRLRRVMDRGLTLARPEKNFPLSEETGEDVYEFLLAEPYSSITGYFLKNGFREIIPLDSESTLYLPRIPVSEQPRGDWAKLLKENGVLITATGRILTGGTSDPLLLLSIACFSLFVKFFHRILERKREGWIDTDDFEILRRVRMTEFRYTPSQGVSASAIPGELPEAIVSAGKSMVSGKLVDSIFGNLSARDGDRVIITEAGSFLDSLESRLTVVPMEGPITGGQTPSSEVEVHRIIYRNSGFRFIVHGHPLFTVILSLDHAGTSETLQLPDGRQIPVVEGDDSAKRVKLSVSVPRAIAECGSVIIRGHGIFSARGEGFTPAIKNIIDIENGCRERYFRKLR